MYMTPFGTPSIVKIRKSHTVPCNAFLFADGERRLIVINFDEHGGFADHVPTPTNIPAPEDGIIFNGTSDGVNVTFDYTRIDVR